MDHRGFESAMRDKIWEHRSHINIPSLLGVPLPDIEDFDIVGKRAPDLLRVIPGGEASQRLILEPGIVDAGVEQSDEEVDNTDIWKQTAFEAFQRGLQAPSVDFSSHLCWTSTPDTITTPLRPHQLEACGRISSAEREKNPGYILADGMGLGKTLVALSVIAQDPGKSPNLIVAPASVISTWTDAFHDFVARDKLKCHVYSGPTSSKQLTMKQLSELNIIIVSYDTLRNQKTFRDQFLSNISLQRHYCDRDTVRYHPNHFKLPQCPLLDLQYSRVFYDEAHTFRNPKSLTYRACFHVAHKATFRVAMTATLVQNGFNDLWPYFSVLRIQPFNKHDLFTSHFVNRVHTDGQRGRKSKRGKPSLKFFDPTGNRRKILAVLLEGVSLNRHSHDYFDGKRTVPDLQRYQEYLIETPLSSEPLDVWYEELSTIQLDWQYTSEADSQALTKGWWAKKSATQLELKRWGQVTIDRKLPAIGQARAAAAHPAAPYAHYSDGNDITQALDPDRTDDTVVEETSTQPKGQKPFRALKGAEVDRRQFFRQELSKGNRWKSTRITQGLQTVLLCLSDNDPDTKGNVLVFSHSLPVLDALHAGLNSFGSDQEYQVMRFDGSINADQKYAIRKQFEANSAGNVMLLTYAAGGVGLNLQSATKVILLTPQWVPALDQQTIARAVRSGQKKKVVIYRLWATSSVEEEVLRKHPVKEYFGELVIGPGRKKWPVDWESWKSWDLEEFSQQMQKMEVHLR